MQGHVPGPDLLLSVERSCYAVALGRQVDTLAAESRSCGVRRRIMFGVKTKEFLQMDELQGELVILAKSAFLCRT